jgi:hypothetical protein
MNFFFKQSEKKKERERIYFLDSKYFIKGKENKYVTFQWKTLIIQI